ncbi:urease accessory protein UreD [Arcobacter sp. CECT 8985]|uniref:urease accessory protein UreD n=1 Tax=Arcobacter sp. CECT 8985 TaxID=1935424 RepID=UPI00100A60CA|nr:urease accessory protein UreD [Arcobacter sp. CECT 8985]RXJ86094.1 urease accessory protein UreD [Arcobacter sp. CECT 8985]
MSIKFDFKDNKLDLKKLSLPSRHYYFNDDENYIKLLNIGEGIFPKDRVKTSFNLYNSSLVLTTESATKIYPSKKEYGISAFNINIKKSNLEFINDELILYKNSKYIQTFKLNFDEESTFFYTDILSQGRSFEDFDFISMLMKNRFTFNNNTEYLEKFDITGKYLKEYIFQKSSKNRLFAKIYIKTNHNEHFLNTLHLEEFESFAYSKHKKIIIGSISSSSMSKLKQNIEYIWKLYRKQLNKKFFVLGKQ